jgi:hypothetical protein
MSGELLLILAVQSVGIAIIAMPCGFWLRRLDRRNRRIGSRLPQSFWRKIGA